MLLKPPENKIIKIARTNLAFFFSVVYSHKKKYNEKHYKCQLVKWRYNNESVKAPSTFSNFLVPFFLFGGFCLSSCFFFVVFFIYHKYEFFIYGFMAMFFFLLLCCCCSLEGGRKDFMFLFFSSYFLTMFLFFILSSVKNLYCCLFV